VTDLDFGLGAIGAFLLALTTALTMAASPLPEPSIHRVTLPLPARVTTAPRLNLVVDQINLPRRQPAKFRVYASDAGGAESLLGSFAVLAESSDAQGNRSLGPFRMNVSKTLRRWLDHNRGARELPLIVKAVDGAGTPVPMSIGSVRFETPKPP